MLKLNINFEKGKIAVVIAFLVVISCVVFMNFENRTKTDKIIVSDEGKLKSSATIDGHVAIFRNDFPWAINITEKILVNHSISYTIYDHTDMGVVDLTPFEKVIIVSDQDQNFYDALGSKIAWFDYYVLRGGILEIHAADDGWNGGIWNGLFLMPGGINQTHISSDNITINLPTHSILSHPNIITDDELDYWSQSAHGYFNTYPINSKKILIDGITTEPVFIESVFGKGTILISMQPLEWGYYHGYSKFLENVLLYVPETPTAEPGIPGYNLYILIGIVSVISAIYLKKRIKSII
ncbi:MAG: hypothetical protein ACFFBH_04080 [Promethearchaeota archaeon]